MDIRVLRYFLAVAREETINGAANYLHVTQPTLSRQLMDLEEELGKKLFLRGNRKITLTDAGLFLRKRAQEIVDLADKTEEEFHAPDEAVSGDIYIGGGETEAMRLIAQVARKLQTENPHLRYHLYSGNGDDVTERLDKGLLDFGVLIEPVDVSKYEFLRIPEKDTWGVLMRKDSPLSALAQITPSDLVDLPIITSRQTMVFSDFTAWLGRDFEQLNIVATYNLLYNATLLVEEGMGYAVCLDRLINTTGDSSLCFRPLYPRMEVHLDIVWKKYQVFSRAAERFLQRIQESFPHPLSS